jgi:hypothetical protein
MQGSRWQHGAVQPCHGLNPTRHPIPLRSPQGISRASTAVATTSTPAAQMGVPCQTTPAHRPTVRPSATQHRRALDTCGRPRGVALRPRATARAGSRARAATSCEETHAATTSVLCPLPRNRPSRCDVFHHTALSLFARTARPHTRPSQLPPLTPIDVSLRLFEGGVMGARRYPHLPG